MALDLNFYVLFIDRNAKFLDFRSIMLHQSHQLKSHQRPTLGDDFSCTPTSVQPQLLI